MNHGSEVIIYLTAKEFLAWAEIAMKRMNLMEEEIGRLKKTVAHLCPDKSDDI